MRFEDFKSVFVSAFIIVAAAITFLFFFGFPRTDDIRGAFTEPRSISEMKREDVERILKIRARIDEDRSGSGIKYIPLILRP